MGRPRPRQGPASARYDFPPRGTGENSRKARTSRSSAPRGISSRSQIAAPARRSTLAGDVYGELVACRCNTSVVSAACGGAVQAVQPMRKIDSGAVFVALRLSPTYSYGSGTCFYSASVALAIETEAGHITGVRGAPSIRQPRPTRLQRSYAHLPWAPAAVCLPLALSPAVSRALGSTGVTRSIYGRPFRRPIEHTAPTPSASRRQLLTEDTLLQQARARRGRTNNSIRTRGCACRALSR